MKKIKHLLEYLEILEGGLDIGVNAAAKFAISAVSKDFRKTAEVLYRKLDTGKTLSKALSEAGFIEEANILAPYEEQGDLRAGIKALKELLSKKVSMEEGLNKLDNKVLLTVGIMFVALIVLVNFYLPTVTEKLVKQITYSKEAREDVVINFLLENFSVGYLSLTNIKRGVILALILVGIIVAVKKFKISRLLLKLIPAYRKMLETNDKITILSVLLTSPDELVAVKNLAKLFRTKYNFQTVARNFSEMNYKAFRFITLFNEDEKGFIMGVGNTANKGMLEFMLKGLERKRDDYLERTLTITDLVMKISIMVGAVILWAIPMLLIGQITSVIK